MRPNTRQSNDVNEQRTNNKKISTLFSSLTLHALKLLHAPTSQFISYNEQAASLHEIDSERRGQTAP